jgi:hypothetical protein
MPDVAGAAGARGDVDLICDDRRALQSDETSVIFRAAFIRSGDKGRECKLYLSRRNTRAARD